MVPERAGRPRSYRERVAAQPVGIKKARGKQEAQRLPFPLSRSDRAAQLQFKAPTHHSLNTNTNAIASAFAAAIPVRIVHLSAQSDSISTTPCSPAVTGTGEATQDHTRDQGRRYFQDWKTASRYPLTGVGLTCPLTGSTARPRWRLSSALVAVASFSAYMS